MKNKIIGCLFFLPALAIIIGVCLADPEMFYIFLGTSIGIGAAVCIFIGLDYILD